MNSRVALSSLFSQEYTDGKLKVLVYHNSDSKVKKLSEADLRKYDVIMISCTLCLEPAVVDLGTDTF